MNVLERALELCRLDQAMNEAEALALIDRDVEEQFTGEAFARLLAATILGFAPGSPPSTGAPVIHNVVIADGFSAGDRI